MFVHGGGFSGSILDPDKAAVVVPDVEYFVRRGFVGFQLNYRLMEDNATFPKSWPGFPRTGGSELGVQPGPIPIGSSMFESQRFKLGTTGLLTLANDDELGGTICHPKPLRAGSAPSAEPAVDSGCLTFAGGFNPPVPHLYPAVRDIKAAVRWLRADGAARFNVEPAYITLDGGSAGACTILGAGLSQVSGDYAAEVPLADDPTLATTHLGQSDAVRSLVVHWGAPFAVDIATAADPEHRSRYRRDPRDPLPAIISYNGLVDTTVPIEHIRAVQRAYAAANGTIVVRPLPNQPHACWDATVTVGGVVKSQSADAFEFITREQHLQLQP
eukprot:g259.t1